MDAIYSLELQPLEYDELLIFDGGSKARDIGYNVGYFLGRVTYDVGVAVIAATLVALIK